MTQQIHSWYYILSFTWLPFHFVDGFFCYAEAFKFDVVPFFCFCFYFPYLSSQIHKILRLRSLSLELMFSSMYFTVSVPETPIQKNQCTAMFIAAQFTIAKCWEQPNCPSVNEWIKKLVHLHNGILCRRKKEGAPTLHGSMDGTGEHYAKWNKLGNEREIPYDLTCKWNLMNKTNKQVKYKQRHWNKEHTDSDQRGGGRAITRERRGRVIKKHV